MNSGISLTAVLISSYCSALFAVELDPQYDSKEQCMENCRGGHSTCQPKLIFMGSATKTVFQCECEPDFYISPQSCHYYCSYKTMNSWYIKGVCDEVPDSSSQTCSHQCKTQAPEWMYALFALCGFSSFASMVFLFIILPCCLCCPCCPWTSVRCGRLRKDRTQPSQSSQKEIIYANLPPLGTDEPLYATSNQFGTTLQSNGGLNTISRSIVNYETNADGTFRRITPRGITETFSNRNGDTATRNMNTSTMNGNSDHYAVTGRGRSRKPLVFSS